MNPKPFVASSQISGDGHGFNGFNVADIGSNIYGSNQYKFGAQYTHKPIIWPGLTQGFGVNSNKYETLEGNSPKNIPVNTGYGVASLNGFKMVREYTPVFPGHGASSTYGYSTGQTDFQNSFMSSDYNTQKQMYSGSGNVGRGFKYTNVMLPTQYITDENKPGIVRWYGNEVMISKTPKFSPSAKQQTMNVSPKYYGSISNGQQSGNANGNEKMFGNGKLVTKVPEFSQNKKQKLMDVVPKDFTFNQMGNFGFGAYNGQQGSHGQQSGNKNNKLVGKVPEFSQNKKQQFMDVVPKEFISSQMGNFGFDNYNAQVSHGQQSGNTNSKLVGKVPEFSQNKEQQFMEVVPKDFTFNHMGNYGFDGYNEQQFENSFQNTPVKTNGYSSGYSSVPSLESSLRDIYKMVNEEKRKSNGKAIFLVGQIEIPKHMSANLPGYPASTSFSNTFNAFSGYKY